MSGRLSGKVCLVTGATRPGIGKGIALQLGEAGATVYITGRTLKPKGEGVGGSLEETAQEITARGGTCIPVQCDHANDDDIKALFERIEKEQKGRLDVLVNNAYSAVNKIFKDIKTPFWEQPVGTWDEVNRVGLRNHYFCSVYAARLMVPAKQGLIVNISSPGGLRYLFNACYGIGKAAVDRMAADCAHELRKHNVAVVSLWPGGVRTENLVDMLSKADPDKAIPQPKDLLNNAESIEHPGLCVVALAADKNVMSKSGRILFTAEVGSEYNFLDVDGRQPTSIREVKWICQFTGHTWLAAIIPSFVKIPYWVMACTTHKF